MTEVARALGPIEEYETVRRWKADYEASWGDASEFTKRCRTLQRFCEFADRDPDTLVTGVLRQTEDGMRIRPKARREVVALIASFEEDGGNGRRAGNVVRSFLIHNGVALSASVQL